jgi:hypothetical protein
VELLQLNVPKLEGQGLQQGDYGLHSTGHPDSIDNLRCHRPVVDYRLEVRVADPGSQATVVLGMVEVATGMTRERWRWRGALTSGERNSAHRDLAGARPRGELVSPWRREHIADAASVLSRELVCGLRHYTVGVTVLHWPLESGLPTGPLADTVSATRHYIGAYRELDVVLAASPTPGLESPGVEAMFAARPFAARPNAARPNPARAVYEWEVVVRAKRLDAGIWQLWLSAAPIRGQGPGVQAVTYILQPSSPRSNEPSPGIPGSEASRARVIVPVGEMTTDFPDSGPDGSLQVELLGATRLERKARADLKLRLRLHNAGGWPLAFGLKSSAGFYDQCLGTAAFYRHQVWGRISGVLQPGEIRIEELVVRDLRHRPSGVSGQRFCAGFRDLDKFSDYRQQGAQVTDYLRWAF